MTTYTSSTGKSEITDMVSGGYSCEMTIPNTARDRNKEFEVVLKDCLDMKKHIQKLERELDKFTTQDLVWFARHEVKGLDREQTGVIDLNKIKADALRHAVIDLEDNLNFEACAILTKYAGKLERGE